MELRITMAPPMSASCPVLMIRAAAHPASTPLPAPTPAVTAARPHQHGQQAPSMSIPSVRPAIDLGRQNITAITLVSMASMLAVKDSPVRNAIAPQNWQPDISATCRPLRLNWLQVPPSGALIQPLVAAGTILLIHVAI